ncbi:MAG: phage tail tube protein [Lachnospiraceae bacterium]|nr:phage tail tube protein [Lachnospiraceae bacterium]
MDKVKGNQVFNGREGEMWLDGAKIAEVKAAHAEVIFEYKEITLAKKAMKERKLVGLDTDGNFTLYKTTSMMTKKLEPYIRNNQTPLVTIIIKVDDKDAVGAERVACYNCSLDHAIIGDFDVENIIEEDYKFKFTEFEMLDLAE